MTTDILKQDTASSSIPRDRMRQGTRAYILLHPTAGGTRKFPWSTRENNHLLRLRLHARLRRSQNDKKKGKNSRTGSRVPEEFLDLDRRNARKRQPDGRQGGLEKKVLARDSRKPELNVRAATGA